MNYRWVLLGFLLLGSAVAGAQEERVEPPVDADGDRVQQVRQGIIGKVVDTRSRKGAQGVTVQLFMVQADSLGAVRTVAVGTTQTRANGDFSFTGVPATDSFRVQFSAVSFEPREQWIRVSSALTDLGNINLEPAVQTLQSVTVSAQRSALQLGVDRRVFNAASSLTAAGGTAVDLMKNIPSVSVDVDGNVQLRNTAPQIFVDGRPTILTLDQIPADNIDRVELITNPSAKFDASSSGGIINIILKKNRRVGMNGVASVGAGHPDIRTANLNLNMRQGKFNFFVVGSLFQGGGIARGESERFNKENERIVSSFRQTSSNNRLRRFGSVRFGADYFLDNRNTITLTQSIVGGRFTNEQSQGQLFFDAAKQLERTGSRTLSSRAGFNRYNTQLNYAHKFPQAGRELSASINYNYGNGTDNAQINNLFFLPNGAPAAPQARLRNEGENDNDQLTMQVDYETTYGETGKLEAGVRSFINNQQSIFNSFAVNNGTETKLPLSNNYKYRELINAAYVTYTGKLGKIGYQAGLRAEHSQFDGELVDSARKFGYTYPSQLRNLFDALFPSLYLTHEMGDGRQVQLNYSRRIRRPDFWNLNPFVDINDPLNISQGNPQLRPEFTNSFEANYSREYKSGNFLGALYFRNTQGDITRYSDTISAVQYAQLNNAAIDSNAILSTFINAQYTNRLGAEFTVQQKFGPAFDLTPTINLQYRKVAGSVGDLVLDNEGFNWEAKLIANYRAQPKGERSLWKDFSVQAIGEYESREVVPQGVRIPNYSVDLALRKDFLKNKKATVTFSVQDLFNHLRFGSELETASFYQESWSRRNVRSFRLVFTYKFGDPNFSFGRKGGNRDGGGDQDD